MTAARHWSGRAGRFVYRHANWAASLLLLLGYLLIWLVCALRMDLFRMFVSDVSLGAIGHFLMMLPMSAITALLIWLVLAAPFGWLLLIDGTRLVRLIARGLLRIGGYRYDVATDDWRQPEAPPTSVPQVVQ